MSLISDPEQHSETEDTMIKAWSYSRYENFRKCKLRAKLLYIDKLEEPQRPLKEGQTEQPNDRGTRIHEGAELFVKGGVELLPELEPFRAEYLRARELHAEGKVSLEGEWGFDHEWNPVAWMSQDVKLRVKLDLLIRLEPAWAVVVDLKTGRRQGNELKHAEQVQMYVVATLLKFPEIERVTGELWYPDINELHRVEYSRAQGLRFFKPWNERGIEITSATTFPPNPNRFSCQYCRFGPSPKGNGACPSGV